MSEERTEDRLLRIAREAGYEPTGCERPGGGRDWFLRFAYPVSAGAVRPFCVAQGIDPDVDPMTVIDRLKRRAGPENQPDAVRARKLDRGPCDTRLPREEHQIDPHGGHCVKCLRTGEYMEATRSLPKPEPVCEACGGTYVVQPWTWSGTDLGEHTATVLCINCSCYTSSLEVAARIRANRAKKREAAEEACEICGTTKAETGRHRAMGRVCHACWLASPTDVFADGWQPPTLPAEAPVPAPEDLPKLNPIVRIVADMVDTIIAAQCEAGGVDTEGSRHEAERWCAWLCQCVCDGMRATTEQSALRLVPDRRFTSGKVIRGDLQWWNTAPEYGGRRMTMMRGKPLGRP